MKFQHTKLAMLIAATLPLVACTTPGINQQMAASAVPAKPAVQTAFVTQSAYINAAAPGWEVKPLMTVGDSVNKKADGTAYYMVGVPDGLGAYVNDKGQLVVLMNHELKEDAGVVRAHGGKGAFVSQWIFDKNTLNPVKGEDLVKQVFVWDDNLDSYLPSRDAAFSRLCSADLPALSAFYNAQSGKGYNGRIFMNGEEATPNGRAFAHVATGANAGTSYELPALGRFAMENVLAHPNSGDMTLLAMNNDAMPGQVYFYIGEKQKSGSEVDQAGLTNGKLYGVKTSDAVEDARIGVVGAFVLEPMFGDGKATGKSGTDLLADSRERGITAFSRPEDGVWDVKKPNVYYFVTTDKFDGDSRLYKLTFNDIKTPAAGGMVEPVLNGRDIGAQMFDNITMSADGKLYIQEDPGKQAHLASIWEYDPASKKAIKIMVSDAARFTPGQPGFLTTDEENSGILDITALVKDASWFDAGKKYLIGTTQAHYKTDAELVEGGQLYLMSGPTGK
jgi:hypothetical protein